MSEPIPKGVPRKRRTGARWQKRKASVLERDGWRCRALGPHVGNGSLPMEVSVEMARFDRTIERCEARTGLEVHHLKNRSQGGTDREINLLTLCRGHHRLATLRRPVCYLDNRHRPKVRVAWVRGWEPEL